MKSIIALDVGLKRIGLAHLCADVIVPLEPIVRINRLQAAACVNEVLLEKQAEILVVGALSYDSDMNQRVRHFVGLLNSSIPVVYIDESYSSKEALQKRGSGLKKKRYLDSLAAMLILERYCCHYSSL